MAIYDFKKKPNLTTKEGETEVLYPSIVYTGKVTTRELLETLASRSTFRAGEVEGALTELVKLVGEYVGKGYHVELGDFGVFSGKIKSRMVADKKDIRSRSIAFNGVNFRASKEFRSKAVGDLERSPVWKFRNSRQMEEEERKQRMLAYIDKHGFINRVAYTRLTGRLKDVALKDLKEFVGQGIISRVGYGNQLHFVRTNEEAFPSPSPSRI